MWGFSAGVWWGGMLGDQTMTFVMVISEWQLKIHNPLYVYSRLMLPSVI